MHEIERNRSQKLGCQANGGARAGRAPPRSANDLVFRAGMQVCENNQLVCSLTKPRLVAPEMSPALYNESGVGLGTVKNKLGKDDSRRSIDQYKAKKGLVTTKGKELIYTVFFNRSTNSSSFTNDYYYHAAGARSKNSAANHSTFQKTSELFSIGGGHVVPVVNNTTCFSIYKWLLFLLLFSSYFPLLSHSFLK